MEGGINTRAVSFSHGDLSWRDLSMTEEAFIRQAPGASPGGCANILADSASGAPSSGPLVQTKGLKEWREC